MKKKKSGISLLLTLLIMGFGPLVLAAIIMITVASSSIKNSVQEETYGKLKVAAEGLDQYFAYDIIANGEVDYEEYSDHEYMECSKSESVELTLFKGDTRFLTSLKNADGTYNEGTQASAEVFAHVKQGQTYTADDVVINGVDYYVYYQPIYDGENNFWGMAFAGTPQVKVKQAITSAVTKLIVVAVVIAALFSIIIITVAVKIKKSITLLSAGLVRLSEGDISEGVNAKDAISEITEMIGATNLLQEKLSSVVGVVKDQTNSLSSSIGVVNGAANESAEGTMQISGAMDELSGSTMTLSENAQDVNNQAVSMGEYIQGISENVEALSNASDEIKDSTENAQEMMNRVLESSEQSSHAVDEITESIALTNASIVKITESVNLISEIASQTNLLALNASIEAARAGDAGRGFAVVAEEIGKLATESADTANNIRALAEDMTAKSNQTVGLAKKIGEIIKGEQECVETTQNAFESLGASIEESLAMITEINAKTNDLSGIKDGILANITNLSSIAEQNAASNQEVTASVATIAERVGDMSAQSDEMKSLSDSLQEAVSYFK